ncbi:hypothetical protein DPMN_118007 [Dreissena polymorpha]|uniref:Uncharacterized protein n=1 Tax=Dreissena polymorpha TaxID=45954 RepID=A0A9D4GJA0_DREPO|nr:hypothetical protein DPMN_118007 [Dreissena polymorpha]
MWTTDGRKTDKDSNQFHEEVLTRINSPTPGSYILQNKRTIFKLIQDIIKTNLTKKNAPPPGSNIFQPNVTIFNLVQYIIWRNLLTKKKAPPNCGHVFQATRTIFEIVQDIIRTNDFAKFHEDLNKQREDMPKTKLKRRIDKRHIKLMMQKLWLLRIALSLDNKFLFMKFFKVRQDYILPWGFTSKY